jgi:hypothetical protein
VFTLSITNDDSSSITGLLISQYTETEIGTLPKGIEVWNNTGSDITFDSTVNKLDVKVGVNGGVPASVATVETGGLADGAVMVIGTSDMTPDVTEPFTFNGDDSIVLEFGGAVVDMIGLAGIDPDVAWTNNGVSTKDQNIQIKAGITTGDADGWTNVSERFEFVANGSDLTGFGTAPSGGGPAGDQDGDQIPDSWESEHFGGPTNANASSMSSNGVNSVMEAYVAGLNPTSVTSYLEIPDIWSTTSRFINLPAVSGRVYTVEFATNLTQANPWNLLKAVTNLTDGLLQIDDPSSESVKAYRFNVKMTE